LNYQNNKNSGQKHMHISQCVYEKNHYL